MSRPEQIATGLAGIIGMTIVIVAGLIDIIGLIHLVHHAIVG